MKKVVYVFSGSRKSKIFSNKVESKEFFYGFQFLKNKNFEIEIVEFNHQKGIFLKTF